MSRAILLDSGPLGLVTNPNASDDSNACIQWLGEILDDGIGVYIPEITDYEVRRELIRARKSKGLTRLNELQSILVYLPLTTPTMFRAAELWAETRQKGRPTAHDKALDGDVILAAQAQILAKSGYSVIVATTNVKHLELFVDAQHWRDIKLI